jgi:acetolactate synthase II small subunit
MLELNLVITNAEGALVRLLGTIERRGFRIDGVHSEPHPEGTRLRVALGTTARPADVLVRQLQRLVDVREVCLDIVRPSFALPKGSEVIDELSSIAARARRGLSFLGIPERVSVAAGGAV